MATARYFNEDKAGDGAEHIWGVPARDLTDAEYDAMPEWLQAQVDASPMYRKSPPKAEAETTEPEAAAKKPAEASKAKEG